jgi:diaminohydroxyphosphoribosylaminopyrimidine deaminase/5-amino-6-(5-phosphoribosylamino)uracil reductase
MARAIELAAYGRGWVEPNPMVGCVIVDDQEQIVGEGYHHCYGQAHAEIEAIRRAGLRARGATMFVTLEPCCHFGKTPPCTQAIIAAGVRAVVVAVSDPFAKVAGQGIAELRAAGIDVSVGLLASEARQLNAPYFKLLAIGEPWLIAKWAMTLDGKLATRTGDSRWISGEPARQIVHQLRGRVDAIVVGRGTADADDPLLTARPPGKRTAARIVIVSHASVSRDSQLVRTARETPVIVAASDSATQENRDRLQQAGCEVLVCPGHDSQMRLKSLLTELGRRGMTNMLVEGGAKLLGSLFDLRAIDEVHAFIAAKLVGGEAAISPIAGRGLEKMASALHLTSSTMKLVGDDIYLHGLLRYS